MSGPKPDTLNLDDLSEPAAVLDHEGCILACNAAWRQRLQSGNALAQIPDSPTGRVFRDRLRALLKGQTIECLGEIRWTFRERLVAQARPISASGRRFLLRLRPCDNQAVPDVMQSLTDQLAEPVFVLDPSDGRPVYSNGALRALRQVEDGHRELNFRHFGRVFQPELLVPLCITLRATDSTLELCVIDDGKGFVAPRRLVELAEQEHYGLVGMQERAELCGGSLSLLNSPEAGTRVEVSLPLEGY
jgi:hypothetical protein